MRVIDKLEEVLEIIDGTDLEITISQQDAREILYIHVMMQRASGVIGDNSDPASINWQKNYDELNNGKPVTA